MDLRQLKYFIAIVECGAFSRAAQQLNVAQPSLTQHVQNMEAELGAKLLSRSRSGVVPTEEGVLLLERARAILGDFGRMREEIASVRNEPVGTVRLGLPTTVSDILSVPLITRCRDRYPGLKIIIAEAMSGFVGDWLATRRVDIGIVYAHLPEPDLHCEPLLQEELVVLTPKSEEAGDAMRLSELSGHTLILPSAAHGLRSMLDTIFDAQNLDLTPAIELDSYSNIKRLVEAGYGCSILPYHAVAREQAEGTLSVLRVKDPELSRRVYLARDESRPQMRAIQIVIELIREAVGDLIAEGRWPGARDLQAQRPGPEKLQARLP